MKAGTRVTLTDGWLHHSMGSVYPKYGTCGTVKRYGVSAKKVEALDLVALLGVEGKIMLVAWDTGEETYVRERHVSKGEIYVDKNEYEHGDVVVFKDRNLHQQFPQFYPPPGTEGSVYSVVSDLEILVQWPKGTTSANDRWFTMNEYVYRKGEQHGNW